MCRLSVFFSLSLTSVFASAGASHKIIHVALLLFLFDNNIETLESDMRNSKYLNRRNKAEVTDFCESSSLFEQTNECEKYFC